MRLSNCSRRVNRFGEENQLTGSSLMRTGSARYSSFHLTRRNERRGRKRWKQKGGRRRPKGRGREPETKEGEGEERRRKGRGGKGRDTTSFC
ncbi:hypothetical protein PoB_004128400 [Plakobranchus ocellatus]|uniref:Uncharacterized protein n=1 Tax=Plakobranchus ocellatus TaxID=259542 RepID=A0AAV4B3Y2_9GAST|nr:hypothetical protein PoB_004128400 [Plakobranchus ocellatus]